MAVMTYKELKKRGLDHGEKWFGYVFLMWLSEETMIVKIDLDHKNNLDLYDPQECIVIDENSKRELIFVEVYDYVYNIDINSDDYVIFGDSLEEMVEYIKTAPILCPVKPYSTYGYKLLKTLPYTDYQYNEYALCILEIPPDARRTNPFFGRKCRADKAIVKAIWKLNKDGNLVEKISNGYSPFNVSEKEYSVGEVVYPDSYDESRLRECTNGIHFYSTIGEALKLHQKLLEKNM